MKGRDRIPRYIRRMSLLRWLTGEGRYLWWPFEFVPATPVRDGVRLKTRSGETKARTRELTWAHRRGLVSRRNGSFAIYEITDRGRRAVRCRRVAPIGGESFKILFPDRR